MKNNELGFPLEYSELHEYFDVLNPESDEAKNSVIERILAQHTVKTVLDLTCGTGSQVFWLAKRNYKVTGVDLSSDLLSKARQKAEKENLEVPLIHGDMRSICVGHFDAVITIANAIGHLTKTDFEKALKNIHANLKSGGVYLFDIFNLQAMSDTAVNELAMDLERNHNNTHIHHIQMSKLDRKTGLLTSYDTFTITAGSTTPKIIKHEFTLQLYTAQELKDLLTKNGFEVVAQYGIDGTEFLPESTTTILIVARKK